MVDASGRGTLKWQIAARLNSSLTTQPSSSVIASVHHQPITPRFVLGEQPMSVETLTYAALGARLKVSPEAVGRFSKRLQLPAHFR